MLLMFNHLLISSKVFFLNWLLCIISYYYFYINKLRNIIQKSCGQKYIILNKIIFTIEDEAESPEKYCENKFGMFPYDITIR